MTLQTMCLPNDSLSSLLFRLTKIVRYLLSYSFKGFRFLLFLFSHLLFLIYVFILAVFVISITFLFFFVVIILNIGSTVQLFGCLTLLSTAQSTCCSSSSFSTRGLTLGFSNIFCIYFFFSNLT